MDQNDVQKPLARVAVVTVSFSPSAALIRDVGCVARYRTGFQTFNTKAHGLRRAIDAIPGQVP